ncbi:hypothetical protein KMZ15_06565 [Mycoavidus sp. HKI]|uniref:hypothetical protein n=1 Tax=Mycoavidus sp. HKI TaxID=2840467 RepID=UPI001CC124F0|nr:hypothetical protein [Mycoavidus sp. HKI]UAW63733.1 hypothetical protein KMZ15_06565 [Mycoavidus sp. HKI]
MRPISVLMLLFISTFIGCGGDNHDNNITTIKHPLKQETNKRAIKSIKEIIRDLEKVNMDSWGAANGGKDHLEEIALDVERSFPQPIGGLMSRTILLERSLMIIVKYGLDMDGGQNILNKISSDIFELKLEANDLLLATTETEEDRLLAVYKLNEIIDLLKESAEEIDRNKTIFTRKESGIIENNTELFKRKAELAIKNRELNSINISLCNSNAALKQEQIELKRRIKYKEELLRAKRLLHELITKFS